MRTPRAILVASLALLSAASCNPNAPSECDETDLDERWSMSLYAIGLLHPDSVGIPATIGMY